MTPARHLDCQIDVLQVLDLDGRLKTTHTVSHVRDIVPPGVEGTQSELHTERILASCSIEWSCYPSAQLRSVPRINVRPLVSFRQ